MLDVINAFVEPASETMPNRRRFLAWPLVEIRIHKVLVWVLERALRIPATVLVATISGLEFVLHSPLVPKTPNALAIPGIVLIGKYPPKAMSPMHFVFIILEWMVVSTVVFETAIAELTHFVNRTDPHLRVGLSVMVQCHLVSIRARYTYCLPSFRKTVPSTMSTPCPDCCPLSWLFVISHRIYRPRCCEQET